MKTTKNSQNVERATENHKKRINTMNNAVKYRFGAIYPFFLINWQLVNPQPSTVFLKIFTNFRVRKNLWRNFEAIYLLEYESQRSAVGSIRLQIFPAKNNLNDFLVQDHPFCRYMHLKWSRNSTDFKRTSYVGGWLKVNENDKKWSKGRKTTEIHKKTR